ncbi:MAG: adenosylcobinamide-GDP ribazoletransferase [Desulfarculus sp.]|nr:adenosylcobinamide-GDP ribazoletransferase [Desulfarculus sp.]
MTAFLLALQFLTVATLRSDLRAGPEDLRRSRAWYAPVGLLLGLVLAGLAWLLAWRLPPLLVAGLMVVLWGALTRFLHLDGVSDTADALVHITSRERALQIMKDSWVGAFGLCAVVGVLLVKFAALASLPTPRLWAGLVLAPALGRGLAALMAALLPPARPQGLGASVAGGAGLWPELAGAGLALLAAGVAAGRAGVAAALLVGLWGLLLGLWFRRRLGGVTGDTLGAAIESAEALALVALTAF